MTLRAFTLRELSDLLARHYAPGEHTLATCQWCGLNPARAGEPCLHCLLNEIAERHGVAAACRMEMEAKGARLEA